MILTCPDCATSYYIPDAALGQGRKVRCATCGFAWRARPEDDEEEHLPIDMGGRASAPAAAPPEEEPEPEFDPLVEELEPPPEPAEPEPVPEEPPLVAPPVRPAARRAPSAAAVQGIAVAAVLALVVAVVVLVFAYRVEVARVWPASAGAFARIGLPVNAVGLTLEEVRAQRLNEAGRPALVVSGMMTNIRAEPVSPPPVSIVLFDRKGRLLTEVRSASGGAPLQPRQARSFQVTLSDPPTAASELEVSFALGRRAP